MMDQEQAERFLEAARRDFEARVHDYTVVLDRGSGLEADRQARRLAREDVLAAQQVLELARTELYRAKVAYEREQTALVERMMREAQGR